MEQSAEKKVIHVHSEVNLIADALLYYTRRANCRPMSASIKRMREQYPENRESIDSLFGPMEELEKALDAASSQVDEERMHFFFDALGDVPTRNRRAYSANLATAIMMPNPFSPDAPSDLAEHCTCIKQRSQEEIIFFARLAFSLPNEGWLTKIWLRSMTIFRNSQRQTRNAFAYWVLCAISANTPTSWRKC